MSSEGRASSSFTLLEKFPRFGPSSLMQWKTEFGQQTKRSGLVAMLLKTRSTK